jgi:hypothetical protein
VVFVTIFSRSFNSISYYVIVALLSSLSDNYDTPLVSELLAAALKTPTNRALFLSFSHFRSVPTVIELRTSHIDGCSYYSFYLSRAGVEQSPLLLWPLIGLLYQPWMIDGFDCKAVSGMNKWQGKPKYSEETYPSVALYTTDPT